MAKLSRRLLARTIATKLVEHPSERRHWIQTLAAYLVEQNRTEEVDLIVNDIAHELYRQAGVLLVHVESAHPLSDSVRKELKDLLSNATKAKHIELTEKTNPELLGGLVARTPDAAIDLSVRTKLKQLATIA